MNIVVIMPYTEGKYEDDTMMHCRALETYGGHTILRGIKTKRGLEFSKKSESIIKGDKVDLIWAPYEDLIDWALMLKSNINKPIVGHYEILLPGRFRQDEMDMYWDFYEDAPDKNKIEFDYYYKYKKYVELYNKCDIKTITGQHHKFRCEKALGLPVGKTYIKPYPFDNTLYDKYAKKDIKEKRQICTIYRLVAWKKTRHIIKALSLMKNPPKYVVAGTGNQKEDLEKYAKELGVNAEFRGHISDEEKVNLLQESMFSLSHYGWIPPTEAAYLKKPCICYYEPDTYERLSDLPYYTQANNIKSLAKSIEKLINDDSLRKKIGESAYDKLINNKTHTHLLKEDSKQLTKIFEEALK